MGPAVPGYRPDGNAAVVLVDCAGDRELEVVRDTLAHALDTPTVLIDRATMASAAVWLDLSTRLLHVDGRRISPTVVWIRHSSASAMVARAYPAGSPRALDAVSWSGLLAQVVAYAGTALPGGGPGWPGQLADVSRHGVHAPRTVVGTDVAAAARQVGSRRVIVKTPDFRLYEPDPATWPAHLPRVVDASDTSPAGNRPVVVQEYVAHTRELRVYYLDGAVCAFDVRKADPASPWTDPARVTVSRIDCPADAESAVRVLCAAWRLRYAAFDLLVTAAGELVFLEANPDGGWLWFERKARWQGVSFLAAVMVRELFVRGTS